MVEGTDKVLQLLQSFDDVMLVTHGIGSTFDARPMRIANIDNECNVWFLSDNDGKILELQRDPHASIIAEDKDNCWLSITGTIEINSDIELIKSLWKEDYWRWFPQGFDSPGIRVLHFNSERAEYWDQRKEQKIEYIIKTVRAYVSGVAPEPDNKSHESVLL